MTEAWMLKLKEDIPMPEVYQDPEIVALRQEQGIDTYALIEEAWHPYIEDADSGDEPEHITGLFEDRVNFVLPMLDYITGISKELPKAENLSSAYDRRWGPRKHGDFTYSDIDEAPYALYDDKSQPVAIWGHCEITSVTLEHYKSLLEKTLYARLKERLVKDEPLLLALNVPEPKKPEVDMPLLKVLKNALRRGVEARHGISVDGAPAWSPVYREFTRRAGALDDDPPQRPMVYIKEEGFSSQLRQQFYNRSLYYSRLQIPKEYSPEAGYHRLLYEVCYEFSFDWQKATTIEGALHRIITEQPAMDMLDLYAASLNDIKRQEFSQWLSDALDGHIPEYGFDDYSYKEDSPSYDSVSDLLSLSEKQRTKLSGVQRSTKPPSEEFVFEHNGGEVMEGRMAVRAIVGLKSHDTVSTSSVLLESEDLDEEIIVPGFTTGQLADGGLEILPAERDPYDISVVRVPSERLKTLAELCSDAGLSKLANNLKIIATKASARLDLIVDAIEANMVYDMEIGWAGNASLDLTRLNQYGLVEMATVKGNCTVAAGFLSATLEILGQKDIQILPGVVLGEQDAWLPLHAQVSFVNPTDNLTYVADATGSSKNFIQAWTKETRLGKRLGIIVENSDTSNTAVQNSIEPEATKHIAPGIEDMAPFVAQTQTQILEIASTLAKPSRIENDLRVYQIGAMAQLDEQHILRQLYVLSDSLSTPTQSYVQFMSALSKFIDKCDRLAKPQTPPRFDPMNPVEKFRHQGQMQSGRELLYSNDETVLTYARQIAANLRAKLAKL
jgi:hypothetical protein